MYAGGPGCSSLEGAFSESGLYKIQEFSDPPVLYQNPYSWANVSNQIFIEAPAGVGFSYCEKASGCTHSDTSTAADNLAALVDFFSKFPEFRSNPFWISGESYAGIYVPSLAYDVYNFNLQANSSTHINLKGIAVGNGCIGNAAGHCADADPTGLSNYHDIQQWRGHGLLPETLYDDIMSNCDWPNPNLDCDVLLGVAGLLTSSLDVYDLYNTCSDPALQLSQGYLRAPFGKNSLLDRIRNRRQGIISTSTSTDSSNEQINEKVKNALAKYGVAEPVQGKIDPNCFSTTQTLQNYFNLPNVKSSLHVAPNIDFALCSNNFTFNYNSDIADERTTIYPTLTQQAGYKVLVFNGEADLCVPYTDNEWWTRSMNYSMIKPWTAWTVQGEEGPYVGGYCIHYAHNFTFATVRGAGHMVPETRPEAALTLIKNHIFNQPWN